MAGVQQGGKTISYSGKQQPHRPFRIRHNNPKGNDMRKYLLAAVAAAALSTPGVAQPTGPYAGIEGGVLYKAETEFDVKMDGVELNDALEIDYKSGFDLDAIAGYDFGRFRAEAELGYKRLKIDNFRLSNDLIDEFDGQDLTPDDLEVSDRANVLSGMINLLFDVGGDAGPSFYAGGGAGVARVKTFGEKDTGFAWQLIAGLRVPISATLDAGVKYRFFNANADFEDDEDGVGFDSDGRFRSQSILASLIFKFGAPRPVASVPAPAYVAPAVAEPLPAPPPVATQRCYDGSVIPVTTPCPLPPQPPIPRGERG